MSDYDMSIHDNPDAQAWAKLFAEKYKVWSNEGVESDTEGLMIGWFANAMMAMHDHIRRSQVAETEPVIWQELSEDGEPLCDEGTFSNTKDSFDYARPLYART